MVDPFSNRPERRPGRPLSQRPSDPLDQRLDRWMSAGRQFVDGVSGARPGSRAGARGRTVAGRNVGRPSLDGLGRWVEDRLDWLLEDEDDWREPWQQERMANRPVGGAAARTPVREIVPSPWEDPAPRSAPGRRGVQEPATSRSGASPRRPLEAVSRREGRRSDAPQGASQADWPDPEDFQVPRWQRPAATGASPTGPGPAPRQGAVQEPRQQPGPDAGRGSGRALPRSSRRRS